MSEPTPTEIMTAVSELRAAIAELRADWAARWSLTNDRLDRIAREVRDGTDDLRRRSDTLFSALAEFRAEYNGHHHEEDAA